MKDRSEYSKNWYQKNKIRLSKRRIARYLSNKEKELAKNKQWRLNNIQKVKQHAVKNRLKLLFNLTLDDYNQLLIKQNNCCAICEKHKSEFKTALHVDHCHKTNKIRGLLCGNCNRGLGLFFDNIKFLAKAEKYLEHSIYAS